MIKFSGNIRLAGHAAALFTAVVWGITFVSTKLLLADFTPVEILFLRFSVAYAALYAACPGRLPGLTARRRLVMAVAGASGVCLYYLLENVALTYTLASNVSVILSLTPMFTAVASRWIYGREERLGPRFLTGFAVAMSGIALISLNGSELSLNPLGDLLALAAGCAWAAYSCSMRTVMSWEYPLLQATRSCFGWGLLFMLPAVVMGAGTDTARFADPVNLGNLLFLGLVASAMCFTTWNIAMRNLGVVGATLYLYMIPVITVAAAMAVLGEPVTLMACAGIALTLAGLRISQGRHL